MKSRTAQVYFNDSGTPVADDFDDVYFSNDSGIDETHHVFIAGNDIPARWLAHTRRDFVIAETGFGTGLNCLVAMQAFAAFRAEHPEHPLKQLFILSTEKFPMARDDLARALTAFPVLEEAAKALLNNYPLSIQGCHRLHFDEFHTTLDLWIGDVHELLPQWHVPPRGMIDAWFLDGFAPGKNPDMWTEALFSQMARVSRQGATFGTFTAAGIVKRGLRDAGFVVEKRKGFGRKRDMLCGYFDGQHSAPAAPPYSRFNNDAVTANHRLAIIGGGLAAATLARSLSRTGISATVLCADETLAQGASGNPQGGFYPQLHSEASIASQIQAHGFLYASRVYRQLPEPFTHDWCGVLQLNFSETVGERQAKLLDSEVWPEALVCAISQQDASDFAGVPLPAGGLHIPLGGWVCPPELVSALIAGCDENIRVQTGAKVTAVTEQEDGVTLCVNGKEQHFDYAVIATGADSIHIPQMTALPLRPVRGQVEAIPGQPSVSALRTVLCHKGYMTPHMDNRHALGSTYGKDDTRCDVRESDTQTNMATHKKAMGADSWVAQLQHDGKARAAIRLTLPDHQPATGQLLSNDVLYEQYRALSTGKPLSSQTQLPAGRLFTLTGLGSRGLTTAPLMAQILTGQLTHTPLPAPESLLQATAPQRFAIRNSIRGVAP
ncbi:bifunctional tRNA (5-methylaminomethyl-2-thiouridine)(34)-methyltransferase MnmD/FAD-dependent 5-carboxymethylaminomethyl-2-thiouridine(34) oxidoreductase MnmC [Alteromonas sp. NFXS44]|uniref:bifunctional tRNA (5-methylaminomethyl-2-thiouridine)(34)-methyltransferase MnmD/FAD-dependent 5-carboxymethylaminomethyl-2-thiouridine(34) oxidoreductase MnmC n=1 Tax=Alteromonas sp. NFXS44 TaxID=2818435 RepID=UPI0032DF405A